MQRHKTQVYPFHAFVVRAVSLLKRFYDDIRAIFGDEKYEEYESALNYLFGFVSVTLQSYLCIVIGCCMMILTLALQFNVEYTNPLSSTTQSLTLFSFGTKSIYLPCESSLGDIR